MDLPRFDGLAWICMDLLRLAWIGMDLPGFDGLAWICMDLLSLAWIRLVLHGFAWIVCMDLLE